MTRPSNPANYQCEGKMANDKSRGYTVHHWLIEIDPAGVKTATCQNRGCGLVLSAEDTMDFLQTRRT